MFNINSESTLTTLVWAAFVCFCVQLFCPFSQLCGENKKEEKLVADLSQDQFYSGASVPSDPLWSDGKRLPCTACGYMLIITKIQMCLFGFIYICKRSLKFPSMPWAHCWQSSLLQCRDVSPDDRYYPDMSYLSSLAEPQRDSSSLVITPPPVLLHHCNQRGLLIPP